MESGTQRIREEQAIALMRCFYSDGYFHRLPDGHPFPMEKFREAHGLLLDKGTLRSDEIEAVEPAREEVLLRVHSEAYLEAIRSGSLDDRARTALGLPPSADLLQRSALETEGTRRAAWAALETGTGVNLAGGTHHAFAEHGEGFCVLNDVAVAAWDLWQKHPTLRILIADTDAHQGNGTHALLAAESRAHCYSIHVGRNYPSRKEPGDTDVELPRNVDGREYLEALAGSLPEVFTTFRPDLVIWISGADPHRNDRFGQMQLSARDLADRDRLVLGICRDVPLTVLYGGGYNRQPLHTAQLHAQTVTLTRRAREKSGSPG